MTSKKFHLHRPLKRPIPATEDDHPVLSPPVQVGEGGGHGGGVGGWDGREHVGEDTPLVQGQVQARHVQRRAVAQRQCWCVLKNVEFLLLPEIENADH